MLQQSKQVRRIGQDDAAAASHTAAAVMGDLPLSSANGTERATSAKPQATTNGDAVASKSVVQSKAASQSVKPKPLPSVTVKAKAPQVMVKAKRKADDAEQTDKPPNKKQTQDASVKRATDRGLAGLAAYGSDSDNSGTSQV